MIIEQDLLIKDEFKDIFTLLESDAMNTSPDEIFHMDGMRFEQDGDYLILNTDEFGGIYITRDYTIPQLLGRINWGHTKAFKTLPLDIKVDVLNHFLKKEVERKSDKQLKIPIWNPDSKLPVAKAFLSKEYKHISTYKLVATILVALEQEGMEYDPVSCYHSWTNTYIRFINPNSAHPVMVGDEVRVGFQLKNSETGHSAIGLQALTERISCENMAVFSGLGEDLTENIRHIWINPKRVQEDIVDAVLNIDQQFEAIKPLMDKAAQISLPVIYQLPNGRTRMFSGKPHDDFERLFENVDVSRTAIDAAIKAFQLERGRTLWHVLNAINYTKTLGDVNKRDELKLQEMFGDLLMELRNIQIVEMPDDSP